MLWPEYLSEENFTNFTTCEKSKQCSFHIIMLRLIVHTNLRSDHYHYRRKLTVKNNLSLIKNFSPRSVSTIQYILQYCNWTL